MFDHILEYNSLNKKKNISHVKKGLGILNNDICQNLIYQNICYRIMEHNIWMYDPKHNFFESFDRSKMNEINKKNFKKIDDNESLLFLLSLVDTIEFIKKMSTTSLDNIEAQSRPSTISNKIKIEVNSEQIIIDTQATKNIKGYDDWIGSINGLNNWMKVEVSLKDNIIMIKKYK